MSDTSYEIEIGGCLVAGHPFRLGGGTSLDREPAEKWFHDWAQEYMRVDTRSWFEGAPLPWDIAVSRGSELWHITLTEASSWPRQPVEPSQ